MSLTANCHSKFSIARWRSCIPMRLRLSRLLDELTEPVRQALRTAALGKNAMRPQILAGDRRVEGHSRQASRHVVEQLAGTFGQAQLGRHSNVSQGQMERRLLVEHPTGEDYPIAQAQFVYHLLDNGPPLENP